MILTAALIVLALWILGIGVHIGGGFINLLLVIGIIMLIAHFMSGRPHHGDI